MAKVVAPLVCKVEAISKPKPSQHSDGFYHSVLFLDESQTGDEAKVWKNLSGEEVSQLMRGDRVQLVPAGRNAKGNDKHNIVLLDSTSTAPHPLPAITAPAQSPELTPDQKRAIATFGSDVIKAYSFLYKQAKEELEPLGATEETIGAAASSALIACQKKLGFDR